MSKSDVRDLRRWYGQAAMHAGKADFDFVDVHVSHNTGISSHFILRRCNERTDKYGRNLEDTKEAVGERCRETRYIFGTDGIVPEEARIVIATLADLPVRGRGLPGASWRVRQVRDAQTAGVGRFTSPDTTFPGSGAARPSIPSDRGRTGYSP